MSDENKKEAPETTQDLQTAKMPLEMGQRGLQLSNLDDAWRFCTAMAASGMMPKGMQTAQQILYALELGFEVGLPPLAAVQSIAVINGRASLYGDVMLGLVLASGKFDDEAFEEDWIREGDKVVGAYCIVRRLPKGKPRRWDFTIEDAKTANLWGKEGPWRTAPKRMLQMRARAFALRDIFPDVLKGIISREEAGDIPPEKNITNKSSMTRAANLSELTDQLIAETPIDSVSAQETSSENAGTETEVAAEQKSETVAKVSETAPAAKAAKKTKIAETATAETAAKSAETKPTETAPIAAPPPKPKPETAPAAETQAPAAQATAEPEQPEGSKKFRNFIWLKEELSATGETRHTPAELAETMVEVKRTGITLEKWVKSRLECAVSDITSAGMQKITAMLKTV